MFKEHQKILVGILFTIALYYFFCKCFEKFDPFDPYYKGQIEANKDGKRLVNESDSKVSGNGCGKDPMYISSNLLPKTEKTGENYFEGLNVPVDASNIDLPLERQFYSSGVMKNSNLGLRAEPPNPQKVVSPWMNTSISHAEDSLRRPLDSCESA